MCQYACAPAPKTVRVWTEARSLRSSVLASAVRKAVSVAALMRARGAPEGVRRVMEPLGEVSLGVSPVEGFAAEGGGMLRSRADDED